MKILLGLSLSVWLLTCAATSVREVSLKEMLEAAELVFEGEVTSVSVQAPLNLPPFTRIDFRVLEVIKGHFTSPTLTLDFLGGEVGPKRLAVEEMHYPKLGEHGIYFVESLRRRQVNPLYGWSQGHFLAQPDRFGVLRVLTYDGQPVTSLSFEAQALGLSRGVAKGVKTRRDALNSAALSLEDFKHKLHDYLLSAPRR
jgi:hypothetical protein